MPAENFFESLPTFRDFGDVVNDQYYTDVPEDWHLFVTDVKNSTEAIEAGRYRDVNKIGAGSITVVREALEGLEFPFVFGGDGATLVIPPEHVDVARKHLLGLKELAREQFDLDLRVGSMPVRDVLFKNVSLEVARLEITPGRVIAIFRGGGMTMADDMIKRERERYEVTGEPVEDLELTGLSCRWQPVPSDRGNVLSLLIQVRVVPPEPTYREVLRDLDEILKGGLDNANPIDDSRMSYKSVGECIRDEVRYHSSIFSPTFILRFLEILLAVVVFKYGFNPGFFDPDEYSSALRTHSDYRKFDDMLRLIIDCDSSEVEAIENHLEQLRQDEQIFYGVQEADESLMTCYVESLDQGGHLHFVDGGSGGYARASKQLKDQVREAADG